LPCYNIHDIVKIQSEVPLYELEYFKCDSIAGPDLLVRVSDAVPARFATRRRIIKPRPWDSKYLAYFEHLGSLGAKFSIDFSDLIEINVNNLISKSRNVLYVNLVEPILRFVMISKGYILLHSACVDFKGHGLLLSAPPDTGKTTTVLKLVKNGYAFLSDDMTIISLPNNALCYPKPMTISAHTYRTAVEVSNNEAASRAMKIRSVVHSKGGRSFMHRLARYNLPIFTINAVGQMIVKPPKFKIDSLLNSIKIEKSTLVKSLYFLSREGNECEILDTESALMYALDNSDDAFLFPPYQDLLDHIVVKGQSASTLLAIERQILKKFLSGINCFALKSKHRSWYNMIATYTESKVR
jgi:dolichol-phosphate mannosyltransferase